MHEPLPRVAEKRETGTIEAQDICMLERLAVEMLQPPLIKAEGFFSELLEVARSSLQEG